MNWKIPGWAASAGAVVSLAAGLAGGNAFGTILLRAVVSALLAGALGFAARYVLRRFLPDFGAGTQEAPPPGVDILIDEEVPLDAGAARAEAEEPVGSLEAAGGEGLSDSSGLAPDFTPGSAMDELGLGGRPGYTPGYAPRFAAAEVEPFSAAGPSAGSGAAPGLAPDLEPAFDAVEEMLEPAEGAEELPPVETLEALSAGELEAGPSVSSGIAAPGRRALKAEELEAQLDNVTKGQDPVSLAKAVRTFLRKDQEG